MSDSTKQRLWLAGALLAQIAAPMVLTDSWSELTTPKAIGTALVGIAGVLVGWRKVNGGVSG